MRKGLYTIAENAPVADRTYRLVLTGEGVVDGEFVHVSVPGFYLRRPLSICDCEEGRTTIVYRVVGDGTRMLSGLKPGEELEVLTGLGRGFDPDACREEALLVGGGLGVPPLYLPSWDSTRRKK